MLYKDLATPAGIVYPKRVTKTMAKIFTQKKKQNKNKTTITTTVEKATQKNKIKNCSRCSNELV